MVQTRNLEQIWCYKNTCLVARITLKGNKRMGNEKLFETRDLEKAVNLMAMLWHTKVELGYVARLFNNSAHEKLKSFA